MRIELGKEEAEWWWCQVLTTRSLLQEFPQFDPAYPRNTGSFLHLKSVRTLFRRKDLAMRPRDCDLIKKVVCS